MMHVFLVDSALALLRSSLRSSLRKCGAVAAVARGIHHQAFSALAAAVAGFDLLSGPLAVFHWHRMAAGVAR